MITIGTPVRIQNVHDPEFDGLVGEVDRIVIDEDGDKTFIVNLDEKTCGEFGEDEVVAL